MFRWQFHRAVYSLDIRSNVVDLGTHLVGNHFTGGRSCICSQHHPILQQMKLYIKHENTALHCFHIIHIKWKKLH